MIWLQEQKKNLIGISWTCWKKNQINRTFFEWGTVLWNMYCKALFFRGGLIFAYFAENENSAKIKPAKIKIGKSHCKSVGVVCMHAYCTKHTKLLSLSSEIHKVPVLHPFIVLCTLWIALPTSTHKLQSILANKRKRKNRPQCESAKINPARILILAKARKKDPSE